MEEYRVCGSLKRKIEEHGALMTDIDNTNEVDDTVVANTDGVVDRNKVVVTDDVVEETVAMSDVFVAVDVQMR